MTTDRSLLDVLTELDKVLHGSEYRDKRQGLVAEAISLAHLQAEELTEAQEYRKGNLEGYGGLAANLRAKVEQQAAKLERVAAALAYLRQAFAREQEGKAFNPIRVYYEFVIPCNGRMVGRTMITDAYYKAPDILLRGCEKLRATDE